MGRAERIEGAFAAAGETGQAVFLAQAAHPVTPSRQDLVGIALVADVPDDGVAGSCEYRMNGNCEFDHAQARAQMATGFGYHPEGLRAQFLCQATECVVIHFLQVVRGSHLVEQRGGDAFRTRQAHCAFLPRTSPFL